MDNISEKILEPEIHCSVTVKRYAQDSTINKSYETPARVQTYVATQDHVVPKKKLFKKIVDILNAAASPTCDRINILEPGMGPAAFSRFFLENGLSKQFSDISIYGADISHSMVEHASSLVRPMCVEKSSQRRVSVNFSSGVNCINLKEPYYQEIISSGMRFDAIIASQFEHYCPNHHDSELAVKLKKSGIEFATKKEFREFCYKSLLNNNGIYFSIDDRLGESPLEHEKICYAWDRHIVKQFTDSAVLGLLSQTSPALVRNLKITYDPNRSEDELIRVAAKSREHRRDICFEEIEPFSQTQRDFDELFGPENTGFMDHPDTETHPGFYLVWGSKK